MQGFQGLNGIVLAAGAGSRTGYLADILPKTLLPVAGKPLIWHALSALADLGVSDAKVVTGPKASLVRRFLKRANVRQLGLRTVGVKTLTRATRNQVESLLRVIPASPGDFAVTDGDSFTQADDLPTMRFLFEQLRPQVMMMVVMESDPDSIRRACEVAPGENHRIDSIREKPLDPLTFIRGCGFYIFRGDTFHSLVREAKKYARVECIPDLVAAAIRNGAATYFQTQGRNVNVNTIADLQAAWSLAEGAGQMPL